MKRLSDLLLFLCLFNLTILSANAQFSGGDGTPGNPYLIENATQLDNVRQHPDKHFRLTASIDLNQEPYNEDEGWVPIGTTQEPFTGSLDGNGHTIRNLMINRPGTGYQGLFGDVSDAKLRHIQLLEVDVTSGGSNTGGLAGRIRGNTFVGNSRVTGNVQSTSFSTGGVIGSAEGTSRIFFVSADVEVSGNGSAGGLAGSAGIDIRYSWSAGAVTGTGVSIGGLVGHYNAGHSRGIADSYSHASVSGVNRVGGLVGNQQSGDIHRSFSTGAVSGEENTGGLIGSKGSGNSRLCFWNTQTSGRSESAGGEHVTGKTTAEMQQRSTYQGYNFNTVWRIQDGTGYPTFRNLGVYSDPREVELASLSGSGSQEDPYIITTAAELNAMRLDLEAHYRLGNNIDLTETLAWNSGDGWDPVGKAETDGQFRGSFDGYGFELRNLTVNRFVTGFQGLFGDVVVAVLREVRLVNVHVSGASYTGGIAGRITTGAILENSRVTGEVIARGNYTGGAVGSAETFHFPSRIHFVSADVLVRGDGYTGGLVGSAGIDIRHSWSEGTVIGSGTSTGGLVGHYNAGHSRGIADSYSHASVTGVNRAGGLVGNQQSGDIHRSFSTGAVSGEENVGGLIGSKGSGNSRLCFWNTQTSGQSESAGGDHVIGKTTAEMQQKATFLGYNLHTLWRIHDGAGYPTFRNLSIYSNPVEVELASLSGSGSQEDPYIITTAAELNAMRQDLEAHYRLGNDIDLAETVAWNSGDGWEPVGKAETDGQFRGSFDGNGFELRNLTVNRFVTGFQGLFGDVVEAKLLEIHLWNVHVSGASYTGGIAGRITTGAILENSRVTGEVIVRGNYAGGAVGSVESLSRIHYVSTNVLVRGDASTGGLAGHASSDIRHSWSTGTVIGTGNSTGGLVGHYNAGTSRAIADSYSHASVTGVNNVGGLAGHQQTGYITRSYSTGAVSGQENVGGLIGYRYSGLSVLCYWDIQSSGQPESAGGDQVVGLTTADMMQRNTFRGYNFFTLWEITEGTGYPSFQDLRRFVEPEPVTLSMLTGSGTEEHPYIITTAAELAAMSQNRAAHYRLGSDIDLSSTVVWNNGLGWEPVGLAETGRQFSGSFDGNGYEIRNLTSNWPNISYQGFLGDVAGAELRNIRLEEAQIASGWNSGLLAARMDDQAYIENSSVTGEIVSGGSHVGGLVGVLRGARGAEPNRHLYALVDVWGDGSLGGLAGVASSNFEQVWSAGSVNGRGTSVGGLIGHYNAGDNVLRDSYSLSAVTGNRHVGGFIGHFQTGSIWHSYSAGAVSGNENVGGFIGDVYVGSVRYCYWDIDKSGQTESAGGELTIGKSTDQMTYPYTDSAYNGFNFIDTWNNDNTGLNGGYPYLRELAPALHQVILWVQEGIDSEVRLHDELVFRHGEQVTVVAIPTEGWAFLYWTEDGIVVSDSPSYTFIITSDRSLTAHFTDDIPLDSDPGNALPHSLALTGNYPNPFNAHTTIRYELPAEARVNLEVFDLLGRRVAVLVDEIVPAGRHEVRFDASNLSSGIYISRLSTQEALDQRTMMLLK